MYDIIILNPDLAHKYNNQIIGNFLEFIGIPYKINESIDNDGINLNKTVVNENTIDLNFMNIKQEDYRKNDEYFKEVLHKIMYILKVNGYSLSITDELLEQLINLFVDCKYYNHFEILKMKTNDCNYDDIFSDLKKGVQAVSGEFTGKKIEYSSYHILFYIISMQEIACPGSFIDKYDWVFLNEYSYRRILYFDSSFRLLNVARKANLICAKNLFRILNNLILDSKSSVFKINVYNSLGKILHDVDVQFDDEISYYEKANQIKTNYISCNLLGGSLENEFKNQYLQNAITILEDKNEISPYEFTYLINTYYKIAQSFFRDGNWLKAIDHYNIVLKLFEKIPNLSFWNYFLEDEKEKIMIDYTDGLLRKYFEKIKRQKEGCCSMADIVDVKNDIQKYNVESYQKKIVYKKDK